MVSNSSFSAIDSVKIAWEKVRGAKKTFWAVLLLAFIFQLINYRIGLYVKDHPESANVLWNLISIVVSIIGMFLSWGLIYLGIQRARDMMINVGMIKHVFNIWIFLKMIGASILEFFVLIPAFVLGAIPFFFKEMDGLVVIAFFTLAVIVGIYLLVRMFLVPSFVIAENMGPIDAIKRSFAATDSHVLQLLGLFLINWGIMVVSALLLAIPFIWTLPYVFINLGVVYKKLS